MASKRTAHRKVLDTPQHRVIYIHGIGPKPERDILRSTWDDALFGTSMARQSTMAYWADLLHEPAGIEDRGRMSLKAINRSGTETDTATDTVTAWKLKSADKDRAVEFMKALRTSREVAVRDRGAGAAFGKRVLPFPGFFRRPIAKLFLENFVHDTAAYFFRPKMREAIQKRLRDVLPTDGKPITLIAHSQGSVVAYEVLSSLARSSNVVVDTLVTIGSPLGIQEVQDFLQSGESLQVPRCVRRWYNFADPLDAVAFDKSLGDEYSPLGFITDHVMFNDKTRINADFDPHSAVGYLAHPRVRSVVHNSVRFDTRSHFVVARDVAQSMASPSRQSVLIEARDANTVSDSGTKTRGSSDNNDVQTSSQRIARIVSDVKAVVGDENLAEARIDPLERYVAAQLTPREITALASKHAEIGIHTIWKSSAKRKLETRSARIIQVDAARQSYEARGSNITWAVLDTGVNTKHPHFRTHNTILDVWDCTKQGAPKRLTSDKDIEGHGTHVSGIIAGEQGGSGGHVGMAPLTKLVVYKVLNDEGTGEDAWIIKALDHIAQSNRGASELKIHGVNLSLGGSFDATVFGCGHSPICRELRHLWRSGVVVCTAAGNEGQTPLLTDDGSIDVNTSMSIGDPANLEDSIVVGSVHADKPRLYGVSSFSSRGPTLDGRIKPDVVAPGERIASCHAAFASKSDEYVELSGTSMAAPHVSGLIAAFLSVRREYIGRPDEVKALLKRTCTDIGRDVYHQGAGLPNLMKMLMEA